SHECLKEPRGRRRPFDSVKMARSEDNVDVELHLEAYGISAVSLRSFFPAFPAFLASFSAAFLLIASFTLSGLKLNSPPGSLAKSFATAWAYAMIVSASQSNAARFPSGVTTPAFAAASGSPTSRQPARRL